MDVEEDSNEAMEINSSSDSLSFDDEQEQQLTAKARELELQISDNKYLYDVHLELVDIYRKLVDLQSMRLAYERFHEYFPLTPEIWLAWINDEKKLASSDSENNNILSLFDKAVEDYLSVNLWVEYAQFSIGLGDLSKTRSILERGLTAAGLHTASGILLWDTLREFEFAVFEVSPAEELSEEWKEQVFKKSELFRRQLSIPLIGMENTHKEWEDFFKGLPDGHKINAKLIEKAYNKAWENLATYKPFEDRLLITEDQNELFHIYKDYIKVLNDPSTILCVYERAVAQLCLNPEVWLNYCSYCIKLGEIADKVSKKALRNCTWSEDLWVIRLRILEKLERSDEVLKAFEEGIANLGTGSGLNLWLTYLEQVRRKGDQDKLQKLFEQAQEQFQLQGDSQAKILRFHARTLAKTGDMPGARKVWKQILKNPKNKTLASVWLEFASLERQYGDHGQLRSVFQRAIGSSVDWPQCIVEEWQMFEREFGSLEDVLKCTEKCREVNIFVPQQTQEEVVESHVKGKKRKIDVVESHKETSTDVKKIKKDTSDAPKQFGNKVVKDPTRTVFISNLYPSINEKKLKKVFPNAVNIEIVTDKSGKSRCYGYVQFNIEEEVMTALARDRELLDGRPIFISNCKPDRTERKALFKYSNDLEETKLFIKGLPVNKTQEDVESIYKPLGAISVRLVLQKSGKPKGLAYVEFPDKEKAKDAMEKTNQMKFGEHIITVAISAPPIKGAPKQNYEPVRHSRSRLQVPMIPRSLQVKSQEKNGGAGEEKTESKPKSNDDFRKMLLKS